MCVYLPSTEVRGQPPGVSYLYLSCGSRGPNTGCQAHPQAPLLAEPVCQSKGGAEIELEKKKMKQSPGGGKNERFIVRNTRPTQCAGKRKCRVPQEPREDLKKIIDVRRNSGSRRR